MRYFLLAIIRCRPKSVVTRDLAATTSVGRVMSVEQKNIRHRKLATTAFLWYETTFRIFNMTYWCLQSGNLRTPEKTSQEIRQQFESAFKSGATTKIQNSVSLTGVRDTASGSILNALVELGKKLRKRTAGCQSLPENEVEATL